MKTYTYIVLVDVSYHNNGSDPILNKNCIVDNFEKTCEFLHHCRRAISLENCIIVYGNNWGRTREDIDILKNIVNMCDENNVLFKECYTSEDLNTLKERYPPRRIFITGGNLCGCIINKTLPINYFSLREICNITKIVPELCYDTTEDIYKTWHEYSKNQIEIVQLDDLRYYLFEQSIRNRGFLYTRYENDYEIYIKTPDLFKQR